MSKAVFVSSKIKKYLDISQLESTDKGQVYVLNSEKAQILISVPKINGNGSDLVKIPNTFIPLDLTTQVMKRQLMDSSEFRKTISKGLVKVVNPEYAAILLDTPEAKAEVTRINNELQAIRVASQTQDSAATDEDEYVDAPQARKSAGKEMANAAKSPTSEVSQKLKQIVANSAVEEWTQPQIVAAIKRHGDLTTADRDYLGKKYKNFPRVDKFLRETATD